MAQGKTVVKIEPASYLPAVTSECVEDARKPAPRGLYALRFGSAPRTEGASLGEIFSFISGLYFRGKLAYARAYADRPPGGPRVPVITASGGLISPDTLFTLE